MNPEQMAQTIQAMAVQMERLATGLEHMTIQMRGQNERMDKIVDNTATSMKEQGERVGKLEIGSETQVVVISKLTKRVDGIEDDIKGRLEKTELAVNELKTRGSRRLDGIIDKITCVAVGAAVMYFMARFGM